MNSKKKNGLIGLVIGAVGGIILTIILNKWINWLDVPPNMNGFLATVIWYLIVGTSFYIPAFVGFFSGYIGDDWLTALKWSIITVLLYIPVLLVITLIHGLFTGDEFTIGFFKGLGLLALLICGFCGGEVVYIIIFKK